ncbi:hypothetical protein ACFLUK_01975 [Chloroflexota bacterium]
MTSKKILVRFPGAEEYVTKEAVKSGVGLSDVRGKRIALLSNGRPNVGIALESLRKILTKDYASEAFIATPPNHDLALADLPPDMYDHIASQADGAVVGVGT